MKKVLVAMVAAALLLLAGSAAWGQVFTPGTITIDDRTDTLSVSITQASSGIIEAYGPVGESLSFSGSLFVGGPLLTPGSRMVVLTGVGDPLISGIPVSDFALVFSFTDGFVGNFFSDPDASSPAATIKAFVDAYNDDLAMVTAAGGTVSYIPETGDFQGIGGDTITLPGGETVPGLNIDKLCNFRVASDTSEVPLPGSALLFGSGLLGLVPAWWLRRQA